MGATAAKQAYIDALVLNRTALTARIVDAERDLQRDAQAADGSADKSRTLRTKQHMEAAKERAATRRKDLETVKQLLEMDGTKNSSTAPRRRGPPAGVGGLTACPACVRA